MAIDPARIEQVEDHAGERRWHEDVEARLLVACVQRGEHEAAGVLYERYFDCVCAYLHASLGNGADAEDLAQQVFINAFRALSRPGGEPISSFRAWVFVIARRQFLKFLRGRGRVWVLPPAEVIEHVERQGSAPDPAERFSGWELDGAVAKLSERQRQILLLSFRFDLERAEIAQVLGMSAEAVRKAHTRALDILGDRLVERSSGRVLRVPMGRRDRGLPVVQARRLALLAA